ncbi:LOW QUALITY PROTEIN: hypothetical protein HID58_024474 [Brassica napus]|uniref:NAC domain-containing protein n=1 Tax=Brassica napus TaxID=3708 RepID=A0ABQ7XGB2_BRANA|nr:LOW QUALITY PROTEIN: hypothetical protein HID58_024474 [Brassica napus]
MASTNQNIKVLTLDSLPVGLRFRPTDEELVRFYLHRKINGHDDDVTAIREIDICKWEPWDLPGFSVIKTNDSDTQTEVEEPANKLLEATGGKTGRKIKSGKNSIIGVKRTLVFHSGRAPKGTRTNWIMHEYRATEDDLSGTNPGQSPFFLCKLFKKQDLSLADEDSKTDVLSPTAATSSPGETRSQVSVVVKTEDVKRYDISESSLLVSSACVEATTAQLGDIDYLAFPELESLNYTMFSHHTLNSNPSLDSLSTHFSSGFDFSGNHSNSSQVQTQYGTNEVDTYISDFVDSILDLPDDDAVPEQEGSAPHQIAYAQHSVGDMSNDVSRTGIIKLQARREQPSGCATDYIVHGSASKGCVCKVTLKVEEDRDGEAMKKGKPSRTKPDYCLESCVRVHPEDFLGRRSCNPVLDVSLQSNRRLPSSFRDDLKTRTFIFSPYQGRVLLYRLKDHIILEYQPFFIASALVIIITHLPILTA